MRSAILLSHFRMSVHPSRRGIVLKLLNECIFQQFLDHVIETSP